MGRFEMTEDGLLGISWKLVELQKAGTFEL